MPDSSPWLLCTSCREPIARRSDRIGFQQSHEHSFINPAGVIYRIGCFSRAEGVVEVGEPSDQFTWFQGTTWRIALCLGCQKHMGWSFSSPETHFYGLVLAELRDEEA